MNEEQLKKLSQPPKWALREITAGRLKGKSDINPQWRYEVMNEIFGDYGFGWYHIIKRMWTENGGNEEVTANVEIDLFVKQNGEWSMPMNGVGGSMLISKEKNGLYTNDEAYKMALTDALSVSMKMLGVASDVYKGFWDGSKYKNNITEPDIKIKEYFLKIVKGRKDEKELVEKFDSLKTEQEQKDFGTYIKNQISKEKENA